MKNKAKKNVQANLVIKCHTLKTDGYVFIQEDHQ